MKFSVILPIYNVEKYLNRCIESIVNQNYDDLEVILVDDNSPDNCPLICDEWARKDNRIKVIHKQNEGLGFTRNAGIKIATGDYICFIDSDDYIVDDYFKVLHEKILYAHKPDVCLFGYNLIGNSEKKESFNFTNEKFNKEKIIQRLLPRAFSISLREPKDQFGIGSAWGGVYRAEFLKKNNLLFKSEREILSEDLIFSINICLHAESVVFINRCLYNYCENAQSLSHSYRKDRFDKSKYLLDYMIAIIEENNLSGECLVRAYENYLINIIVCFKQEINSKKKLKDKIKKFKQITNDTHTRIVCNEYKEKNCKRSINIMLFLIKKRLIINLFFLFLVRELFFCNNN